MGKLLEKLLEPILNKLDGWKTLIGLAMLVAGRSDPQREAGPSGGGDGERDLVHGTGIGWPGRGE
jgi:hypothetical protein